MNKTAKISILAALAAALTLAGLCATLYTRYDEEARKTEELRTQLKELRKQEEQSAVMQSINAQMEEIALQERRISDEQREAAEEQTKVAERMRRHAEEEQHKALSAQHAAQAAEEVANSQRLIAESQRSQAENSKRVADTLSYLMVARQLGHVAVTQHKAGNKSLAELLAYTAWLFTERYHGDIYSPTVYQALVLTSQSRYQWNRNKGSVTDVSFGDLPDNQFLTCSSYGEILSHREKDFNLKSDTIYMNKDFDFRDVWYNSQHKTLFAVSRTGHLLVMRDGKATITNIIGVRHPERLEMIGSEYAIIGENGLALIEEGTWKQKGVRSLPFKVMAIARMEGCCLLFDDKGRCHLMRGIDRYETAQLPFTGQVTAFACSNTLGLKVYGMLDGTLNIVDRNGKTQRLVGHRSRVSKIKVNGWRVYSSSFDGTLNLWNADNAKIEPITIIQTNGWLTDFNFDIHKDNIWCGDHRGNLIESIISLPNMVRRLRGKLKRNFTQDEWEYYIGRNIPYETFINR